MTGLEALWLPILLSAILVFILSSVIHMAPLWHRHDFPAVPNQEAARSAIRALNIPPGDYMMPRTFSSAEMKSQEFQAKMVEGPQLIMTVLPNRPWQMGRTLGLWFLYALVVSLFAGYVASRAVAPGGRYLEVFQFAGTTAFVAYTMAHWTNAIWYGRSLSLTGKFTLDGLIYALGTAGVFGWLWPQ